MARMAHDFCRERAKAFAISGHSAIAVDYTISGLGLRRRDSQLLQLGACLAGAVGQPELRSKCVEGLERLGQQATMPEMPRQDYERLTIDVSDVSEINAVISESGAGDVVQCQAVTGHGRGLVASVPIPRDEAIFAEKPLFAARRSAAYCSQCLAPLVADDPTTGRGTAHEGGAAKTVVVPCGGESCVDSYCSPECRAQHHAEGHAVICQSPAFRELIGLLTADVASEARGNSAIALSMLVAVQMLVRAMAMGCHPLQQEGVTDLSGAITYEPCSTLDRTGALTVQIAGALGGAHLYLEDLLTLVALVQTNEFVSEAGSAVFRVLSMLNHSCVPNAVVDMEPSGHAVLRAKQEIGAGEQLLIDYTAGMGERLPFQRRQQLIQERHFECYCARCVRRQ